MNKCVSKVLYILKDKEFVNSAKVGDEVEIVLDKTVFFPESGGQIGDTDYLYGIGGNK
jgi:alanyl-tRNA synthetase